MNLYGYIGFAAPMIMTEVYGYCPKPLNPSGWPSAPADFTNMLDYNYSANIGVTNWVFDHLKDEHDAVITKLGTPPNLYTNPWSRAASNCSTPTQDWQSPPNDIYAPGERYPNWMLSH